MFYLLFLYLPFLASSSLYSVQLFSRCTTRGKNTAKEVILRQQRHDRETKAALSILEGERVTPHLLPSSVPEGQAPDQEREPLQFVARHATSGGDTLRVLRRLR